MLLNDKTSRGVKVRSQPAAVVRSHNHSLKSF